MDQVKWLEGQLQQLAEKHDVPRHIAKKHIQVALEDYKKCRAKNVAKLVDNFVATTTKLYKKGSKTHKKEQARVAKQKRRQPHAMPRVRPKRNMPKQMPAGNGFGF